MSTVRDDLVAAIAAVELAKSTRDQPGSTSNTQSAEIRCGRLIAQHGAELLKALSDLELRSARDGFVPAHR